MILQRVSPVTHSIGNCLKRVIVIVASVIFFQNPMGRQNQIGAALFHPHNSWSVVSHIGSGQTLRTPAHTASKIAQLQVPLLLPCAA